MAEDRGLGRATVVLGKAPAPAKRNDGAVSLYFDGAQVLTVMADGTLSAMLPTTALQYTAANIAAVAHAVNTTGKFAGKIVFDTTNFRFMRATAGLAASPWRDLIGTNAVTPA